jgi:hypothetical protein
MGVVYNRLVGMDVSLKNGMVVNLASLVRMF